MPRRRAPTSDLRARRTGLLDVVHGSGDEIARRYRIKDILGSGGAGVVYRAYDREGDLDVAIKIISGRLVDTPARREQLTRQIKIARKLSHPNCVRIIDDAQHEARPFMVMPFLEGLSLRRIIDLRLEKGQVFAPSELEPIFDQLCQALDYAHDRTLHGNLKPDNVIVLPDLLKVTDFPLLSGLPRAPFLALQQERGRNLCYLAPEVRALADLGYAADIYSLGVILVEMLTGHVYDDAAPEGLDAALERIPVALADVARGCLPRSTEGRFRSAGALYQSLVAGLTAASPSERAPPVDASAATAQAGSLAYRIDTSMIEAEASAPGEDRWVNDDAETGEVALVTPLWDDGDLIDLPEVSAHDLIDADEEEEETQSLDEPTAEIRALWARLNRSLDDVGHPEVVERAEPDPGARPGDDVGPRAAIDDPPFVPSVVDGDLVDGEEARQDDALVFRESSQRGQGPTADPAEHPRPLRPVAAATREARAEAPFESLPLGPLTRRPSSPVPGARPEGPLEPAEAGPAVPSRRRRWVAIGVAVAVGALASALIVAVKRNVDQQRRHQAEVAALRRQLTAEGRSPVAGGGQSKVGEGRAARANGAMRSTENPDLVALSPRPQGGDPGGAAGPDDGSSGAAGRPACPSATRAVVVPGGRAACVDAGPAVRADGTATIWTQVTWAEADAQCRARGQRLCSEDEWIQACRGAPVGTFFVGGAAGIAEWTSTPEGEGYVVVGGASETAADETGCGARRARATQRSSAQLGFRCCTGPR